VTDSSDRLPRPQKTSFEAQPPDVRSVADSLALRDIKGALRYINQYLAANRGLGREGSPRAVHTTAVQQVYE